MPGKTVNTDTADRRLWARIPTNLPGLCTAGPATLDSGWHFTRIRDLSAGGVALLLRGPARVGARLTLELRNGPFSVLLEARVANVRQLAPDTWLTGCSFPVPLADTELESLLHEPAEVGP